MSKIRIRQFGPIQEGLVAQDGWIDIKKVTFFIGNQGSGKSTVAKLISTFSWMEKALVRGDYQKEVLKRKNKLKNLFLRYHRLENYLSNQTQIEYRGDAYNIAYENGNLHIEEANNGPYPLPQIMYVPAERNFIANVKTSRALKLTSDSLLEFVTEYDNAKQEIKGSIKLPINDVDVEYDKLNDRVNIKGSGYRLNLTEASSGFQSFVPLYLVSWFLSNAVKDQATKDKEPMTSDALARFKKGVEDIWANQSFTDEQRRAALSVLSGKFNKTAFINIVEEAEQNLYPTSQWEMLKSLLGFNSTNVGNKLILTTHSPYLVNYLTLAVKAHDVLRKIQYANKQAEFVDQLKAIVPIKSLVASDDWAIYELKEQQGTITKLVELSDGLPSDENYLNIEMDEVNELFARLLEIQQAI